ASSLSLAISIALTVYLPRRLSRVLTTLTDLLAGIPSVVYGIWGFVVLAPYFASTVEPNLRNALGWLPGFGGPESAIGGGTGLLLGIFILTLMVIPLTTAVMRESLRSVPRDVVEAGLALGATPWEVVRRVRLRVARRGTLGAPSSSASGGRSGRASRSRWSSGTRSSTRRASTPAPTRSPRSSSPSSTARSSIRSSSASWLSSPWSSSSSP
ncbi:phosphate ABC transporter, inner membrane subunit PstC, partial [mine drainage metagenome]